MVIFLPFKGYRPRLGVGETTESRISPPYDVIDDEYLKQLQSMPGNVTNLTLSPDPDKRYTRSRKTLDEMTETGSILPDPPSYYVYDQTFSVEGREYHRRGIVGILKTEEYSEGNIIPHEETFAKVKSDRLNLLRDLETHVESIFGIFPGLGEELDKKVDNNIRLCARYVDNDGVEHRYSRISEPDICSEIEKKVRDQKMLIADGHHRYETALNYAKENPGNESKQFVLCTMVAADDGGLLVRPTHRMIDAEDIGETSAIKKIGKKMKMEEVPAEEFISKVREHLFGMVFKSGRCFVLDNESEGENPLLLLDTYSAQQNVINGVYKADEGKSKVFYSPDLEAVRKEMAEKKHDSAVILNKPDIKTIWNLAEKGKKMPKKTTFFYPKIWSGWVFYKME